MRSMAILCITLLFALISVSAYEEPLAAAAPDLGEMEVFLFNPLESDSGYAGFSDESRKIASVASAIPHAAPAHSHQPAAFPGIAPTVVAQRIPYGVIGDPLPVIGRQLVLPVAVPVRIACLRSRNPRQVALGIGIIRLALDIPPRS